MCYGLAVFVYHLLQQFRMEIKELDTPVAIQDINIMLIAVYIKR